MATVLLNQANNFRANQTATAAECTFLIKGAVSDVEVSVAGGGPLIQQIKGIQPGNVAKVAGLAVGTLYTYHINPNNNAQAANATVTY